MQIDEAHGLMQVNHASLNVKFYQAFNGIRMAFCFFYQSEEFVVKGTLMRNILCSAWQKWSILKSLKGI